MMNSSKRIILHLILCMGSIVDGNKVLFLVVEGLTEALIGRIATPALDALIAKGTIAGLKPEFPSETLPTLQAMVTGQHTEVTGILDQEVRGHEANQILRFDDEDAEYWNYSRNLTTVWNLNNELEGHRTGSILWPGAEHEISGFVNNLRWGESYDIVVDVSEWNNTAPTDERKKRDIREESDVTSFADEETDILEVENVHVADTNSSFTEYVFNKTTDQEWIMWNSQIQATVNWFSKKVDPVNFILFYVNQPGQQIRTFGPESDEAEFAVQKVDQMIANLVEQLHKNNLFDNVNIVITGCHGFTEVSTENVFDISGLADTRNFLGNSPVINIQPGEKQELDTYAKLQTGPLDKYDLYTKNNLPDRYHYKNNDRVSNIVLVAKEGFVFASDFWAEVKNLNRQQQRPESLNNKYGKAGYDNAIDSMQSMIILHGPGIETQSGPKMLKPMIDAVDVFPLLCHLLEIPSVPSNGSLHDVSHLLKNTPSKSIEVIKKVINYYTKEDKLPTTVSVLVISTLVLILLICCGACAIRRRKDIGKNHNYRYSQVKSNRRVEGGCVDGSETTDDKVGLLTSAIMEEEFEEPI
eukprot:GFUD01015914.1.p1 GENE.GFUD01015914.1~~GFUD01015914.1.p1  ORF type:complete len:583 (-),score=126.96 GFUD01015914.1:125-1873(-)